MSSIAEIGPPITRAQPHETHTLTYNADVRHMVGEVVGPSTDGRLSAASSAELFDDGRTRVTFVQVSADDLAASMAATVEAAS